MLSFIQKSLMAAAIIALPMVSSQANAAGTKDEAKAMAEAAAKYVEDNGIEAGKKAFNASTVLPQFKKDDLYVFVYDTNGICIAHGTKESLIGKDRKDVVDPQGKAYIKEFLAIPAGEAKWVDYYFQNPETKAVEAKTSYIVHTKKTNVIVGVGAYK
jgi:cytochrome c